MDVVVAVAAVFVDEFRVLPVVGAIHAELPDADGERVPALRAATSAAKQTVKLTPGLGVKTHF